MEVEGKANKSEKEFLKVTWWVLVNSITTKRTHIGVLFGSRKIMILCGFGE